MFEKHDYPNGGHCDRALHTTHAKYHSEDGKLIARAMKPDDSELQEVEITGLEIVKTGGAL